MGWAGHKLEDGYILYTRGGFTGVYIGHKDNDGLGIEIPEEMLIMLAADTIRSQKISDLEGMTDKEILGLDKEE